MQQEERSGRADKSSWELTAARMALASRSELLLRNGVSYLSGGVSDYLGAWSDTCKAPRLVGEILCLREGVGVIADAVLYILFFLL